MALRSEGRSIRNHKGLNNLEAVSYKTPTDKFWLATCSESSVRITLKTAISGSTTQSASAKSSDVSFLDLLARASSDVVQASSPARANAQGQSSNEPDQSDSSDAGDSPRMSSQDQTNGAMRAYPDANAIPFLAGIDGRQLKNQTAGPDLIADLAQAAAPAKPLSGSANKQPRTSTSTEQSEAARTGQQKAKIVESNSACAVSGTDVLSLAPQQIADVPLPSAASTAASEETALDEKTALSGEPLQQRPAVAVAESVGSDPDTSNQRNIAQFELGPTTQPVAVQGEPTQLSQAAEFEEIETIEQAGTLPDVTTAADGSKTLTAGSTAQTKTAATNTCVLNSLLPQMGGLGRSAGKTERSQSTVANFSMSPAGVDSPSSLSVSKVSTAKDTDAGGRGTQASTQSAAHTGTETAQTITPAGVTVQSDTQQLFPLVVHVAAGHNDQAHISQESNDAAPLHSAAMTDLAPEQANGGAANGASINTARLIQSMSETEMRLGMRSSEFGDIAIRTSVSQQQVQAQISVDHSELGTAISAHIPSLQTKLGSELGLHASIEVNQSGSSLDGGQGQSPQRESKATVPSSGVTDITPESAEVFHLAVISNEADAYRLDIRA